MRRPKELKLKSKGAILVNANGRPVTYLTSPLAGWLGWLFRLARRLWRGR